MRSDPLAVAVTVDLAERLGLPGADRAAALVAAIGGERLSWRISAALPARLDVTVALDEAPADGTAGAPGGASGASDDRAARVFGGARARGLAHAGQPFLGRSLERADALAGADALGMTLTAGGPRWTWRRRARPDAHATWLAGFDAAFPELDADAVALSALAPGGLRGVAVDGAGETTAGSELWWSVADPRALLRVLEHAAIPDADDGRVFCGGLVGLGSGRPWPPVEIARRHGAQAGWSFAYGAAGDAARRPDLALLDAAAAELPARDAWGGLARYAQYRDVIAAVTWHVDDAPAGAPRPARWSITLAP